MASSNGRLFAATRWPSACQWGSYLLIVFLVSPLAAQEAIEVQNNPVANGTILVAPGDPDRSDWADIPWYEEDEEDEAEPVDIHRLQIAHDQANVYFHLETNRWDTDEHWRVAVFLDIDQDSTTGFNGFGSSPLGADLLSEGETLWEFTGAQPSEWAWAPIIELVPRDQTSMLDVEWSVPRADLESPDAFDLHLVANNECCDFGLPLDYYPEFSNLLDGEYFSYELGPVPLPGDFDGSGQIDAGDLDVHSQMIKDMNPTGDLNGDGETDSADRLVWIETIQSSWAGDSNFDNEFNSGDLVATFSAGKYETREMATYAEGDWDGDMAFGSGDLVFAFNHGGYGLGPPAAAAVPEPGVSVLIACGILALFVGRRNMSFSLGVSRRQPQGRKGNHVG